MNGKEWEDAKKYLEEGLREKIEGNESKGEIEKLTDEILHGFFFEDKTKI